MAEGYQGFTEGKREYQPDVLDLDPLHHDAPGVACHAEHLEDGGGDLLPGRHQRGERVAAKDGAQGGRGKILDALKGIKY